MSTGTAYGISNAMSYTITMDNSGRLVIPKAIREQLNLAGGGHLRADVAAGRIELTPVGDESRDTLIGKGGITVLKRKGTSVDAAAAIAAERGTQAERPLRR